ncbi:zf-DHHC-domain-containing protein, partial [Serendipita vermifera]
EDGHGTPSKKWTAYIGPMGAVFLLLLPQPSWFTLINSQYISPDLRLPHAFATTILTLMALSSLAICTFRDPGRPKIDDVDSTERSYSTRSFGPEGAGEDEELLEEEEEDHNDFNSSRKWCRTCWAPKPDRTHHCSTCGRCVLKMDHHCPWLSQCVGHRTHPAFLHLLFCVTALACYIAVASCFVLYSFLFTPIAQPIDDATPLHCLFLVVMGSVFSMVIGSFFGFHIYLCFTNQTTLEQLSPYIILKYLPKPKKARHAPGTDITRDVNVPPLPSAQDDSPYYFPSPPPTPPPAVATNMGRSSVSRTTGFHEWDEHSLSLSQRRLVRRVAGEMYLWDLGWRRNVVATLGSGEVVSDPVYGWRWWGSVLLYGGPPRGDGKTFPRNPKARAALENL